jgi:hypothetical protein
MNDPLDTTILRTGNSARAILGKMPLVVKAANSGKGWQERSVRWNF